LINTVAPQKYAKFAISAVYNFNWQSLRFY